MKPTPPLPLPLVAEEFRIQEYWPCELPRVVA
jgi:hypothetical protein